MTFVKVILELINLCRQLQKHLNNDTAIPIRQKRISDRSFGAFIVNLNLSTSYCDPVYSIKLYKKFKLKSQLIDKVTQFEKVLLPTNKEPPKQLFPPLPKEPKYHLLPTAILSHPISRVHKLPRRNFLIHFPMKRIPEWTVVPPL